MQATTTSQCDSSRSWTLPTATDTRYVAAPSGNSGASSTVLKQAQAQGDTLGSMRHGWGKHTCTNGDSYAGRWRLGKRHGRGRAVFARGAEYEGQWRDDKAEGCAPLARTPSK